MYRNQPAFACEAVRNPSISQSHLQRQFNELILVCVAGFQEGVEDLREKKELRRVAKELREGSGGRKSRATTQGAGVLFCDWF